MKEIDSSSLHLIFIALQLNSKGKPICPRLPPNTPHPNDFIVLQTRQTCIKDFHSAFIELLEPLLIRGNHRVLLEFTSRIISEITLEQEQDIFDKTFQSKPKLPSRAKHSYKWHKKNALKDIKLRDLGCVAEMTLEAREVTSNLWHQGLESGELLSTLTDLFDSCSEIGTNYQVCEKQYQQTRLLEEEIESKGLTRSKLKKLGFLATQEELEKWDFVTSIPQPNEKQKKKLGVEHCLGGRKTCERCQSDYCVARKGTEDGGFRSKECNYHW